MKKIFSIFLSLMIFSCIKEVEPNPNVIVMKNDPRCELVADPGICQAAFQRYYFDKIEKKCKPFIWGGCGVYPFINLQECDSCGCK